MKKMQSEKIYQSILRQLSLVPPDYLNQVDVYLWKLSQEIKQKEQNRTIILNLAGTWNDMPETEFKDFLQTTKMLGNEMFNREIEL